MSRTDDIVLVGQALPRLAAVAPLDRYSVAVTWIDRSSNVVDLAADIFTFRAYAPLRDDRNLFASVHLANDGSALAWGPDDAIDMPATAVARLADEDMSQDDFQAFLKVTGFTRDAAAAQLAISRRLVGYYATGQRIPRHIALACAYLAEQRQATQRTSGTKASTTKGLTNSG